MIGFLNFDKKHAVAGSSKLKATTAGHIYNIKVKADTLDNGTIVTKGALVEHDIYEQADASSTFAGKVIEKAANGNYYVEVTACEGDLLVLQMPELYAEYTTQMKHESNFYNVANDVVRAYELYVGDVFELSQEGFDGEVVAGDTVAVDGTSKLLKKST